MHEMSEEHLIHRIEMIQRQKQAEGPVTFEGTQIRIKQQQILTILKQIVFYGASSVKYSLIVELAGKASEATEEILELVKQMELKQ